MAQYGTYTETGSIIRASDGACIPADPANRDYQEAMAAVAAGDTIAAYVEPSPTWTTIRAERDALLAACDWTQLPDSPLSEEARAAWANYRQALRNVPETYDDPGSVEWPVAPAR